MKNLNHPFWKNECNSTSPLYKEKGSNYGEVLQMDGLTNRKTQRHNYRQAGKSVDRQTRNNIQGERQKD